MLEKCLCENSVVILEENFSMFSVRCLNCDKSTEAVICVEGAQEDWNEMIRDWREFLDDLSGDSLEGSVEGLLGDMSHSIPSLSHVC